MRKALTLSLLQLLISRTIVAQCSDAGVCSIGHTTPQPGHRFSIDYVYGSSGKPDNLRFHAFSAGLLVSLFEQSTLSVTLPYNSQSGPLGSTSGIGDLTIVLAYNVTSLSGVSLQIGGKIATGDDNAKNLPQAYQGGLGTHDILLGLGYAAQPLRFAVGYQLSGGRSGNVIDRLKRGDDVLMRGGYDFSIADIALSAEILAIKRLHESSTRKPGTSPEEFITIPNSDQFQLNLLGRVRYPISDAYELQSFAALPLLQRTINVDGLKRAISFSVGLSFLF